MLHVLVGDSLDDPQLIEAAFVSGKLRRWRVPKIAEVGDAVVFFLSSPGFVAQGVIDTPPKKHRDRARRYGASVRSITKLPKPVPRNFVRDSMPEWGWPRARTLSYVSVRDRIVEKRLLALLDSYQVPVASPTAPPATQEASDLQPQERVATTTYRILRDTKKAQSVKKIHQSECQICGHTIHLPDGEPYAEAHHIKPLGRPHNGPDDIGNILCLCPNHHAELDYGVIALRLPALRLSDAHCVDPQYVEYHNRQIYKPRKPIPLQRTGEILTASTRRSR